MRAPDLVEKALGHRPQGIHVEKKDVRLEVARAGENAPGIRKPPHLEAGLALQPVAEALPEEAVFGRDEKGDAFLGLHVRFPFDVGVVPRACLSPCRSRKVTVVPSPGRLRTSISPPIDSTR